MRLSRLYPGLAVGLILVAVTGCLSNSRESSSDLIESDSKTIDGDELGLSDAQHGDSAVEPDIRPDTGHSSDKGYTEQDFGNDGNGSDADNHDSESDGETGPTECDSGNALVKCGSISLCIDGFCCDSECSGPCVSCNQSGQEGRCSPVPDDGLPDAECDDGLNCTLTDKCDGNGGCVSEGNPCEGGPECNNECHETPDGNGNCFNSAGTACGSSAAECSGQDTCDGNGICSKNDWPDHSSCQGCGALFCACSQAQCEPCTETALANNFNTERSVVGWEMNGGWGLYREAPQNAASGAIKFPSQVFGTDGNRKKPYPGNEWEQSYAITPFVVLPNFIKFKSWSVDEGGYDAERISIILEDGTIVLLIDCKTALPSFEMCAASPDGREPNDWDDVMVEVPGVHVGKLGRIKFEYDTVDSCCTFERGWFIDELSFATECKCLTDADCQTYSNECGTAVCFEDGQCGYDAVAPGAVCGDSSGSDCDLSDTCDGLGYCAANVEPNWTDLCTDCGAGPGQCNVCMEGTCLVCENMPPDNKFDTSGGDPIFGWTTEDLGGTGADWSIRYDAPVTTESSSPIIFTGGPVLGTDGNRQAPYPGSETEFSSITTPVDLVPLAISFNSWHMDEGTTDNKIIEISVDNGDTWVKLVDCAGAVNNSLPICSMVTVRGGSSWDWIVLDTNEWAGMAGQLRFTYNTQDGCCAFERGWYIDNLNFAQKCQDPLPL